MLEIEHPLRKLKKKDVKRKGAPTAEVKAPENQDKAPAARRRKKGPPQASD